eukprot:TRINITY_DN17020_c0_g1_i1.p1 TRINITY_DN17020_c0_g1~~TRINITY_DN17020_c0_g1_i1.p1  ORF type:complete len:386 (-),score=28.60 TRINITY_DN17020_c0_g1_i1:404-1561(-)
MDSVTRTFARAPLLPDHGAPTYTLYSSFNGVPVARFPEELDIARPRFFSYQAAEYYSPIAGEASGLFSPLSYKPLGGLSPLRRAAPTTSSFRSDPVAEAYRDAEAILRQRARRVSPDKAATRSGGGGGSSAPRRRVTPLETRGPSPPRTGSREFDSRVRFSSPVATRAPPSKPPAALRPDGPDHPIRAPLPSRRPSRSPPAPLTRTVAPRNPSPTPEPRPSKTVPRGPPPGTRTTTPMYVAPTKDVFSPTTDGIRKTSVTTATAPRRCPSMSPPRPRPPPPKEVARPAPPTKRTTKPKAPAVPGGSVSSIRSVSPLPLRDVPPLRPLEGHPGVPRAPGPSPAPQHRRPSAERSAVLVGLRCLPASRRTHGAPQSSDIGAGDRYGG